MSGIAMVITGGMVLILSTVLMGTAQWWICVRKRRIREQVYHIYQ